MQVLLPVLLAYFDKAYSRPVGEVVFLIDVRIEVCLDLHILRVEIVVLVNIVDVVILCTTSQDMRKNCMELAGFDLDVIADI